MAAMSSSWPALSQEGLLAGIDQSRLPALVAAAGDRAGIRFLEFFASTLRNPRWFFYFRNLCSCSAPPQKSRLVH